MQAFTVSASLLCASCLVAVIVDYLSCLSLSVVVTRACHVLSVCCLLSVAAVITSNNAILKCMQVGSLQVHYRYTLLNYSISKLLLVNSRHPHPSDRHRQTTDRHTAADSVTQQQP